MEVEMKKHVLIPIAVICACSMMILAQAGPREEFTRAILKTESIQHPIFEKVFPGIEFRVETSEVTLPFSRRVVGWFQDERFIMTDDFNFLFRKVADSSKASVEEIIEAFIRLGYWLQDPDLTVVTQEKVSIEKDIYKMNHRAIIKMQRKNRDLEVLELLIMFNDIKIKKVKVYKDGKPVHSPPLLHGYGLDEVNLVIGGDVQLCQCSLE